MSIGSTRCPASFTPGLYWVPGIYPSPRSELGYSTAMPIKWVNNSPDASTEWGGAEGQGGGGL